MLNLRWLVYLESVYRHKSFTRSSEELYVSQPAISAAVTSLEEEYGVKLINRNSKELNFTEVGEEFMLYVRRILRESHEAEKMLSAYSDKYNSTLKLGVSQTLGQGLILNTYSKFSSMYPDCKIIMEEGPMLTHIDRIEQEEIDLSYNGLPDQRLVYFPKSIGTKKLIDAEIFVALNRRDPLCKKEAISARDLYNRDLTMLNANSYIRLLVLNRFKEEGVPAKIASSSDQVITLINNIVVNGFIGFLNRSEYITEFVKNADDIVFRPFDNPLLFDVGFIYKKDKKLPEVAQNFMKFTQKLLGGGQLNTLISRLRSIFREKYKFNPSYYGDLNFMLRNYIAEY